VLVCCVVRVLAEKKKKREDFKAPAKGTMAPAEATRQRSRDLSHLALPLEMGDCPQPKGRCFLPF